MKRDNRRFVGGHYKPVYTCNTCGRRTRETGHGEADCEMCAYCFLVAGLQNSCWDGDLTQEEFAAEVEALKVEYKRT
jgi:tRNA G26 N,N-dimethylase Trm1